MASRAHSLKNPRGKKEKGSRGGNCLKGRTLAVPSVRGAPNISGSNEHHLRGATKGPQRKRLCHSRMLLGDPGSFASAHSTCCQWMAGIPGWFMNETSRSNRANNVLSLQLTRKRARQARSGSNGNISKRSNHRLLERLKAENAQLRGIVVELMLQILALRDGAR